MLNSFFRYRQAASVAFTGSMRSSIYEFSDKPYCFPVAYMNCHKPNAPARDFTCGRKPLSITERYFNSKGRSYSASFSSYKSKYSFDRPNTTFAKLRRFSAKNLMVVSETLLHSNPKLETSFIFAKRLQYSSSVNCGIAPAS